MLALALPVEVVQQAPAEIQSLYEAAVADRLAGRHAAAIIKLNQVLAARPDDVDARLNLGLSLLALGRLDEADAAFAAVLAVAPDYGDAREGRARVAEARAERTAAPAAPAWRMDLDLRRSSLSAGLPDWTEARLGVARRLDEAWTASGAIEQTERFDDVDVYLEGRLDRRFAGGGAYITLGGAPDADYRPELALGAGGAVALTPGLIGTLDASVARYATGTVSSLQPGVTVALGGDRLELSARWINVWDETDAYRSGYAVRGLWRTTDRLRLSAGYADAPESSEGVTVDVKATSLGAEFDLSDRLLARVGGVVEDRGAYDREELSIGLGWRF